MKNRLFAPVVAALALALAFAAQSTAATRSSAQDRQRSSGSLATATPDPVVVRGPSDLRRAVAARGGRADGGSVTFDCTPPTSDWCADGFAHECIELGGVGQSDPDSGGHSCTVPEENLE